MSIFTVGIIISFVAVAVAGCALNPFAEDNIYKRKNSDTAANERRQGDAAAINAEFQKADIDKDGLISKLEAERVSGLVAIFDRYNSDKDGTLDWNEFTAAMQSMHLSKN